MMTQDQEIAVHRVAEVMRGSNSAVGGLGRWPEGCRRSSAWFAKSAGVSHHPPARLQLFARHRFASANRYGKSISGRASCYSYFKVTVAISKLKFYYGLGEFSFHSPKWLHEQSPLGRQ